MEISAEVLQRVMKKADKLHQRVRDLESSLRNTRGFRDLAITILVILVICGFSDHRYELTIDSPQPEVVEASWWGLHTQRFPIRWMTFDSAGGPYKAWCVQSERGEWYPYFRYDDIDYDYERFDNW